MKKKYINWFQGISLLLTIPLIWLTSIQNLNSTTLKGIATAIIGINVLVEMMKSK